MATLTGACVVALGRVHSGLFGRPDAFVEAARRVGSRAGDRLWPMPFCDDYFEQLKSEIAGHDQHRRTAGGRGDGRGVPQAVRRRTRRGLHLDIAGTAWADDPRPWQVKGATGAAVRLLAELALAPAAWAGTGR